MTDQKFQMSENVQIDRSRSRNFEAHVESGKNKRLRPAKAFAYSLH